MKIPDCEKMNFVPKIQQFVDEVDGFLAQKAGNEGWITVARCSPTQFTKAQLDPDRFMNYVDSPEFRDDIIGIANKYGLQEVGLEQFRTTLGPSLRRAIEVFNNRTETDCSKGAVQQVRDFLLATLTTLIWNRIFQAIDLNRFWIGILAFIGLLLIFFIISRHAK